MQGADFRPQYHLRSIRVAIAAVVHDSDVEPRRISIDHAIWRICPQRSVEFAGTVTAHSSIRPVRAPVSDLSEGDERIGAIHDMITIPIPD
jgi:hypothetical protein